jgi:hypothetical protein
MRRAPLARISCRFGELIRISWTQRQNPVGRSAVIVRRSFVCVWDVDAIIGKSCYYWCRCAWCAWCAICQAMRFQKLKAQMSARAESSSFVGWWQRGRVTGHSLAEWCLLYRTELVDSSWEKSLGA